MSHITAIEFQENWEIETLKAMCQLTGWQFNENKKNYSCYHAWVGDTPPPPGFTAHEMKEQIGKCSHEIKVPNADYSIGIVEKEGKIHLLYDYWQGGYGLQKALGQSGGILKQNYSIAKTLLECKKQRRRVRLTDSERVGWKQIEIEME